MMRDILSLTIRTNMTTSLSKEIDSLFEEANKKLDEAKKLQKLQEEFPDIRKHVGRWGKVAYCSKSVNNKATGFDIRHNCGCCYDSPLEVWPFADTPSGRVYTDPPMFTIGEDTSRGDRLYKGWESKLRNDNIPESIIEKLAASYKEEGIEEDDEEPFI